MKNVLSRLYDWYGRGVVWSVAAVIVLLALAAVAVGFITNTEAPTESATDAPLVTTARVGALSSAGSVELIGNVEAVNEVALQSEAAGRITSVRVGLGDRVTAGQILATIENASEYATLLQAEGAYDAAVAAAASSDVSVSEAKQNAVNTYKSAQATANGIVINTIDAMFSNPRFPTPGVRVDASGSQVSYLNDERYALNAVLDAWQQDATTITVTGDLDTALAEARTRTERVRNMVDVFVAVLPKQDASGVYTAAEIDAFQTQFVAVQQSLNTTLNTIASARDTLARAAVTGTAGDISSANAQVKQALGSLRAAQATYQKTVITTPISGTVNTLQVKTGNYVNIQSPIGLIANNNALIITAYVTATERNRFAIGDTVRIADRHEGTVVRIAPAVDPATKKIEVQIETDVATLANGDTVRVAIATSDVAVDTNADIVIPITALKVETDRTIVFTVSDNMTLVAHTITTGPLLGSNIVVAAGITRDMEIVTDARGLNEGDTVTTE